MICLEPGAAGSRAVRNEKFDSIRSDLGYGNVSLEPISFQDFDPKDATFDVVILHHSLVAPRLVMAIDPEQSVPNSFRGLTGDSTLETEKTM